MIHSRALSFFVRLGVAGMTVSLHAQATTNLSSQGYYADPEVRVFKDEYWIYPTRSVSADDPPSEQAAFNAKQTELRKHHVIHKDYLLQTGLDAFSSPDFVNWTRQHSVLHIPNSDDWYIVYHRHPLDSTGISKRVMAIDKMVFDRDGNIEPVVMTKAGPGVRRLQETR